jgi:catechol 2,3-dioxygenase-like lactoylglutathione lyase family enzyme
MALTLDHVVLAVDELDAASATMRAEGFTVIPGGVHAGGVTHNALIIFEDGTYIELIALVDKNASSDEGFGPQLAKGEGWVGYGLLSDNLKKDVQAIKARGVTIDDVSAGGRVLPTGDEIKWQSVGIPGTFSPFFIQDETPRHLRVPETKPNVTHRNGVTGVIGMVLVVASLEEAVTRYRNLLGMLPRLDDEGDAFFDLRGMTLRLTEAGEDADKQRHLAIRGDAPYAIKLRSRDLRPMGGPGPRRVLGARLEVAPRGAS